MLKVTGNAFSFLMKRLEISDTVITFPSVDVIGLGAGFCVSHLETWGKMCENSTKWTLS
jgi:hypothetical protein